MGFAILVLLVVGVGGAALTALYTRAYGRAGYDDWGNYLALLPMISPAFFLLLATPAAPLTPVLLILALFGAPVLLLVRRVCPFGRGMN